jgi:Fe-S-cluster containining protein
MITECYDWSAEEIITYERSGDCNGCGACCIYDTRIETFRPFKPVGGTPPAPTRAEDYTAKWGTLPGEDILYEFKPSLRAKRCKYYQEGKCFLMQHFEYKPKPCEVFPLIPEDIALFDECSYSFKEISRRAMD